MLAIGFSTTFNDLRTSNCTTCMVNDDRSAYWVPELVRSKRFARKVSNIITLLPILVLSVPERNIRRGHSWRNASVGLQSDSSCEVSLISAPGTISSASRPTRQWNPSQMGFVCSLVTQRSETTQAAPNRKPSLGSGQLPFFGCQYLSSYENDY
jgi:hypothetical protein